MKRKVIVIVLLIIMVLFVFHFFIREGDHGLMPLRTYCNGVKIKSKTVHKLLPDATFTIGTFTYDVNEQGEDNLTKERMEGFKNTIERGALPDNQGYWSDPYCFGSVYMLE